MFVNIQSCEVVKNKIMHLRKCILFYFKDIIIILHNSRDDVMLYVVFKVFFNV